MKYSLFLFFFLLSGVSYADCKGAEGHSAVAKASEASLKEYLKNWVRQEGESPAWRVKSARYSGGEGTLEGSYFPVYLEMVAGKKKTNFFVQFFYDPTTCEILKYKEKVYWIGDKVIEFNRPS